MNEVESFRRQVSVCGFLTLSILHTVMEVLSQSIIFLVDVVKDGTFPHCCNSAKELPVGGHSGSCHLRLKFCRPFSPLCEVEFCKKETVVRSRLEFWDNSDIGQAKPSIEYDVVNFIVELTFLKFF